MYDKMYMKDRLVSFKITKKGGLTMGLPTKGWKNKKGTSDRVCCCGSWKQHWINITQKQWPEECSVKGCTCKPTLGAHVINSSVKGERIVPMCDSCNQIEGEFELKDNTSCPSANVSETCGK